MILFAICLCFAGALLSIVARFSGLVAIVSLVVLAILIGPLLGWLGIGTSASLPWAIVVAVVALQIGYGLGVVVRARLLSFREGGSTATSVSPNRQGRAQADP